MDRLPAGLLPLGPGAVAVVPRTVPARPAEGVQRRQAELLLGTPSPARPAAFRRYLAPVYDTEWVVYAKRPFAGPRQVLDDVGRYTHRIAISNSRLLSIDNGKVRFRWKDYRRDNHHGTMTLAADEFIRRFLIHVLPDGFQRIRYYGFLGNCHRARKLALCRELLAMQPAVPAVSDLPTDYRDRHEALTGLSLRVCPHCQLGTMRVVEVITATMFCLPVPDTS